MSSGLPFECDLCENPRHSAQMLYCVKCKRLIGYCCGSLYNEKETTKIGKYELKNGECNTCHGIKIKMS